MRPVIRVCFFLSGASGLIFELLWTRLLTLVFGSTTLAVSTVLTAFMGGLGLGSYLAGRWAHRVRDPIRLYALAEAAIGIYALGVPTVLHHYPALNQALWSAFGDRYALLSVLRFAASAALLLVPTTLMGATLPVLARFFVSRPWEMARVGGSLGGLYALNLFGAVAGSFLAGFVFLPSLGVEATNLVAASFNLTLAAAALLMHRFVLRGEAEPRPSLDELVARDAREGGPAAAGAQLASSLASSVSSSVSPSMSPSVSRRTRAAVLASFAVSGAASMALQGLWTRALAVVIGSSIYSFTIILLAFLIGLGGGSALLGRLADRTRHPVRWLALVHLGVALAIGGAYLIADQLPFAFAWLIGSTSLGVDAILVCQFALACLAVLPATFLLGAVFPLTMRITTSTVDGVARDVGSAYALNTLGAIVGSFLSGFVIVPMLGLQRGIYAAAVAELGLAALLFGVSPGLAPRRRALGIGLPLALCGLALLLPRWNLTSFSQGFFRVSIAKDYVQRQAQKKSWSTPELIFYKDGVATTVSVDRWGKTYSMKNNGKVDASSDADMPTQVSVGLLPLLLHPADRPLKTALVGFGSGVTSGAVTQGLVSSLEVIELEPAVYQASHYFDFVNHRPLENPLVTARVGDGRNFLSQRTDKFDVIISQPSNPWITGVSNLFTREYFQQIKSRLAADGLFCQWAQLYELAPWNVKSIYRTLRSEFPHVYVFAAEDLSSDTILIATMQPLTLDRARLERRFLDSRTAAEAHRAGWEGPSDVVAQVLLTPDEVESFTAGAPLNTDDNARIEFAAPRDLLGYAKFDPYLAKVYGPQWPYGRLTPFLAGFDTPARMGDLARSLFGHGKLREATLWTQRAEAAGGGAEAEHARLLLNLVATRLDRDPEVPLTLGPPLDPIQAPPGAPAKVAELLEQQAPEVQALVRTQKFVTAYKVMEKWPTVLWDKPSPDFALLAGFLHYKAEFYSDAIELLRPLAGAGTAAYVDQHPAVLYYLGRSQYANADYEKALGTLERYVKLQAAAGRPPLPIPTPAPERGALRLP